jgi:hypothetical protein
LRSIHHAENAHRVPGNSGCRRRFVTAFVLSSGARFIS